MGCGYDCTPHSEHACAHCIKMASYHDKYIEKVLLQVAILDAQKFSSNAQRGCNSSALVKMSVDRWHVVSLRFCVLNPHKVC